MPPRFCPLPSSWRIIGMDDARKSEQCTPADIKPVMMARLIIRETLSESRLVITVAPAPTNAVPSFALNSGVISTLEVPLTRESVVNNSRSHLSSHTKLRVTIEPSSTFFSGHSLMFENNLLFLPIVQESLIKTFSKMVESSPIKQLAPITSCEISVRVPIVVPLQIIELRMTAPGKISQLSPITELLMTAPL